MEKLKVGDKVCLVQQQRFGSGVNYYLTEVIRLTNTMAILANGKKLKNEPTIDRINDNCIGYPEYGDSWTKWKITTPEIEEAAKIEKERSIISNWFYAKQFTDAEKAIIYKYFKTLDIL